VSALLFTVSRFPAVAVAVFGPVVVTFKVNAAAFRVVPVPFGPLQVRIRKLSTPYVAPTGSRHVRFGLPVHDETLKICGVPPLTLTVIDCVLDEIVCGEEPCVLRTALALTIRVALDVVVEDEPAPGIVTVT
jgi:hypothetical protein